MTTFRISNLIIFCLSVLLASCSAKIMNVWEGEEAHLNFSYPCNSTRITLQYGNRAPCYSSAEPKHMSMPPNQRLAFENDSQVCSVQWTIDPVLRDDEGTYILTAYRNGIMLPDYPRIGLRVAYPPGEASCEFRNHHDNGDWLSLHCIAKLGTVPGQIHCYQNGMRLPNINELVDSGMNIKHILLARFEGFVYCCSSSFDQIKDRCVCTDWGQDPVSDSVSDIDNPCPELTSSEQPMPVIGVTTGTITNSSETVTKAVTEAAECLDERKSRIYWIAILTLSTCIANMILIITILSIKCYCKIRKLDNYA